MKIRWITCRIENKSLGHDLCDLFRTNKHDVKSPPLRPFTQNQHLTSCGFCFCSICHRNDSKTMFIYCLAAAAVCSCSHRELSFLISAKVWQCSDIHIHTCCLVDRIRGGGNRFKRTYPKPGSAHCDRQCNVQPVISESS